MYAQPSAITGINVSGHPYAIAVDPKTDFLYVAGILPNKITTIDLSSHKQTNTIVLSNLSAFGADISLFPHAAVSVTAGLAFVAYSDSETLHVIDGSQGDIVTNDTLKGRPAGLAADPNPNFLIGSQ